MKSECEFLSLSSGEVLKKLKTSKSGLTHSEVWKRLEEYGPNEIAQKKKRSMIFSFLSHFKSPILLILLFAGIVSGFFGQIVNSAIIFAMIFLSVVLDFYQERKAEKAAEFLKEKIMTRVCLIRGGEKHEVKISEIVPGDIVVLSAGDIVPADARIIESNDLFVNQSTLTGESFPIEKSYLQTRYNESITRWDNFVFMGTSIVSGSAKAVVVSTGASAEYGKVAKDIIAKEPETAFEKGQRKFGMLILNMTIFLVLFVFFVNAVYKRDVFESLLFALALAVGLAPELLPMIITLTLSKGAIAMSKKGVIVKRLAAIQNLGAMDVLCTDKTGTLTENRIKLIYHLDADGKNSEKVLTYSFLNSYHETGLKSPLDEAIMQFKQVNIGSYKKIDEIPFDFLRKRISVVVGKGRDRMIVTKGAPEEIFKICSHFELRGERYPLTKKLLSKIESKYIKLSSEGFRVLGVAYKNVGAKKSYTNIDESVMTLLGFIAFIDPPKESAKDSLKSLKNSGIEVKILTGDNELVTLNVCRKLGFNVRGIIPGEKIKAMNDVDLAKIVEKANVFTRVTPDEKNRILNILRKNGHVVGFLGDGINDSPSLKSADVGISVDTAVDVAKESAEIILSRKSLRVLHDGVIDGRMTAGNTMKYIMMGTSSNFGNMFSVAGATLFLPFLPMLPIQILLNNFLYDFSESTIPSDKVDSIYLKKPRRWDISFIRRFMLTMGPISSLFDFLTFFLMLYFFKANEALFQTGWFVESLCTQVLVIFVIRTRMPFYKNLPSKLLLLSSLFVVGLAILIPFTPLGDLFGFVKLPLIFFGFLAMMVLVYIGIVEIAKRIFYKVYGD